MALPENIQPGQTGHAALHNATNAEVNRIDGVVVGLQNAAVPAYVFVSSGSEPRPTADLVFWVGGTTQPTNMGVNDVWFSGAPVGTEEPTGDSIAPSVPTNLTVGSPTENSLTATWTASTDAVGVTGYDVQVGGVSVGVSSGTSRVLSGLQPNTSYSVRVRARDAAGNWSALSTAVSATTSEATVTPGTEHTVFGTGTGGLTPARYNDGGTLRVINNFYTSGAGNENWRAVGVRFYLPTGAPVPASLTGYLYAPSMAGGDAPTLINATTPKTVAFGALSTGWNEARFAVPEEMNLNNPIFVGYQAADGSYIHAPIGNNDAIPSSPAGISLSGAGEVLGAGNTQWPRSMYSANGGPFASSPNDPWYGIDIIVDEGA